MLRRRRGKLFGVAGFVIAALLAVLAGCSNRVDTGTGGVAALTGGATHPGQLTFAVVPHGGAGDSVWAIVKNGAMQAGKDLHVKVTYQGSGVPQTQAQLIDAAVNQHVDGLIVSMANPDA